MGKFQNFINQDQPGCEKIYGTYGCKSCKEDMGFAWWDSKNGLFFWICPSGHRTEQELG